VVRKLQYHNLESRSPVSLEEGNEVLGGMHPGMFGVTDPLHQGVYTHRCLIRGNDFRINSAFHALDLSENILPVVIRAEVSAPIVLPVHWNIIRELVVPQNFLIYCHGGASGTASSTIVSICSFDKILTTITMVFEAPHPELAFFLYVHAAGMHSLIHFYSYTNA